IEAEQIGGRFRVKNIQPFLSRWPKATGPYTGFLLIEDSTGPNLVLIKSDRSQFMSITSGTIQSFDSNVLDDAIRVNVPLSSPTSMACYIAIKNATQLKMVQFGGGGSLA